MGLHRVENPSLTDKMATLHFYWPPIKECLIFDEDTSKARKVKMTFTSVKGVKTPFTPSSAVRESTWPFAFISSFIFNKATSGIVTLLKY